MKIEMKPKDARILLGRPAMFAAPDDMRPVLTAVCVEAEKDGVIAVGSDGFRLGAQHASIDVEETGTVLVPARLIINAAKTWPGRPGLDDRVVLTTQEQRVTIAYVPAGWDEPQVAFSDFAIAGSFPNWRQLIPTIDGEPRASFALNPTFAAEVAKAARLDRDFSGLVRWFPGSSPTVPVAAVVNGEIGTFVAVIMTMFVGETDALSPGAYATAVAPFRDPKKKGAAA